MLYIHTSDPKYPHTANLPHDGFWDYPLSDGSHFIAIRCKDNLAAMKSHISTSAARLNLTVHTLPTLRNGGTVHPDTQASIAKHCGIESPKSPLTTSQLLSHFFAAVPDPAYDPDGAA